MFKKHNLYSSFGLDNHTKKYEKLSDIQRISLRVNYLLYLKTQLQLLADEDCDFYRMQLKLVKSSFFDGQTRKEYCVINFTSVKKSDSYEIKYLDIVESVTEELATHLTKLKKLVKEMESQREDAEAPLVNPSHSYASYKMSAQRGQGKSSEKAKRKLASFTIKVLR